MCEGGKFILAGSDTYIEAQGYYYVDKTLFIRDIIDRNAKVLLITRPRRFGKTLNMDMLKTFFEKTDEDTSLYFLDKKIWACGDKYRSEQGRYPVIFLSFKDACSKTWEQTYGDFKEIISEEFLRHRELLNSDRLLPEDIEQYSRIASKTADDVEYRSSIKFLCRILNEHWNGNMDCGERKDPIVLIDEYETPLQTGANNGYYPQVKNFAAGLLSACLKDNPDLSFAVMTGVLGMPSDSLSGGLNNVKAYTVLDGKFSEDFGFTRDEIRELLAYYGAENRYEELCKWYEGYRFGDSVIFNPWSVMNYVIDGFRPSCPWVETGSNSLVGELICKASPDDFAKIKRLADGETVTAKVSRLADPDSMDGGADALTLLLHYGYLTSKCEDCNTVLLGRHYHLAVPNAEIATVFAEQVPKAERYLEAGEEKPNSETLEAIEEVKRMKENPGMRKSWTDVDEMMKDLLEGE